MTTQNAPAKTGTVNGYIESMIPELAKALSGTNAKVKQKRAEEFARIAVTTVKKTPKLLECDATSLAGALMECASFDIYPDPRGQVWLIPYKNKGTMEVQFQLGYKGMIELAYRSGEVKAIKAEIVYENEVKNGTFHYQGGSDEHIRHDLTAPLIDGSLRGGDVVAAYAVAELANGAKMSVLVDKKHIEKRRATSQSGRSEYSPWSKWYEEMCKKTAIKALCKTLPQSIEKLQAAVYHDDMRDAGRASVNDDNLMLDSGELCFANTGDVNAAIEQADAAKPEAN